MNKKNKRQRVRINKDGTSAYEMVTSSNQGRRFALKGMEVHLINGFMNPKMIIK